MDDSGGIEINSQEKTNINELNNENDKTSTKSNEIICQNDIESDISSILPDDAEDKFDESVISSRFIDMPIPNNMNKNQSRQDKNDMSEEIINSSDNFLDAEQSVSNIENINKKIDMVLDSTEISDNDDIMEESGISNNIESIMAVKGDSENNSSNLNKNLNDLKEISNNEEENLNKNEISQNNNIKNDNEKEEENTEEKNDSIQEKKKTDLRIEIKKNENRNNNNDNNNKETTTATTASEIHEYTTNDLIENTEIIENFRNIFTNELQENEMKKSLINLYDKIKTLSQENINKEENENIEKTLENKNADSNDSEDMALRMNKEKGKEKAMESKESSKISTLEGITTSTLAATSTAKYTQQQNEERLPKIMISDTEKYNTYYKSFSGTLQRSKPLATPPPDLFTTINNRLQNTIDLQQFFEKLEKISCNPHTSLNSISTTNSIDSSSISQDTYEDINSRSNTLNRSRNNTLSRNQSQTTTEKVQIQNQGQNHNQSLTINTTTPISNSVSSNKFHLLKRKISSINDGTLTNSYRRYFNLIKKNKNLSDKSKITTETISIPKVDVPELPSEEEYPFRDPLSLGIYYHNHERYDIADYYFCISSINNNTLGLYLHGMYLQHGIGNTEYNPELGFQFLLKSAEAAVQSIPIINNTKQKPKFIRRQSNIFIDSPNLYFNDSNQDLFSVIPENNVISEKEKDNNIIAEKMLIQNNITNVITKLSDEEFETWIVRCIVSLPIYEMGQCFLHGNGVKKSACKATYYFNVAAYIGDADAQLALAQCYKHGIGVKKSKSQAAMWLRKAHSNGKCVYGESWIWKPKYNEKE